MIPKEPSFSSFAENTKMVYLNKIQKRLKRDVHILYVETVQDIYNTNRRVYNKVHEKKIQTNFNILRNC